MFRVNFSVSMARRKWACAIAACGTSAMVTALALAMLASGPVQARQRTLFTDPVLGPLERIFQPPRRGARRGAAAVTTAIVPLPTPRPAEAPQSQTPQLAATPAEPPPVARTPPSNGVPIPEPRPAEADAQQAPAPPPQPPQPPSPQQAALPPQPPAPPVSACRLALTDEIAVAPSIPDITGPGSCGGTDLVRLEAVMVAGRGRVPLKPAATLRCEMATAIAGWIRDDMAPLAASLGSSLAELDNFDSFDCRGRNRVAGAKMSEHGRANALDIRGLKLANNQLVSLTDRAAARETREKVLQSVCARFSTVLGPGSDGYHEDHIHLDLAPRRGGYKICQWVIYEPLPQVAPLMPAVRPDDAPPRQVAEGKTEEKTDGKAAPAATPPHAEDATEPEPTPPPPAKKSGRRVRAY